MSEGANQPPEEFFLAPMNAGTRAAGSSDPGLRHEFLLLFQT